jgi:hypothetical protein
LWIQFWNQNPTQNWNQNPNPEPEPKLTRTGTGIHGDPREKIEHLNTCDVSTGTKLR